MQLTVRKIWRASLILVLVIGVTAGVVALKKRRGGEATPRPRSVAPAAQSISAGDSTRPLPGWTHRAYDVHVPPGYDPSTPTPVVVVIHGGGGNSTWAAQMTCPNGNPDDPKCLNKLADREGFIVAYPNGTVNPDSALGEGRRWNSGGGKDGFACAGDFACDAGIDDIRYFNDLLDDMESVVNVDRARVYATGLSNGGSMSHRLGCQMADRIAAIAPLAAGNQFSTSESCAPGRPVPVLDIHGTDDQFWPYMGGTSNMSPDKRTRISIPQTVRDWAARNGCDPHPAVMTLPDGTSIGGFGPLHDISDGGPRIARETYAGCKGNGDVVHYKIIGAGHTWPQGFQYLRELVIGKTSQDMNANEIIWAFFKAHPKE